jgi:NAD(P)H-hydrate epimerase
MEQFGLAGLVLMENAGRGVADKIVELDGVARSEPIPDGKTPPQPLGAAPPEPVGAEGGPRRVVICCGKGNNAGDGFVIARHLDIRGLTVEVLLFADPDELTGDAGTNFAILDKMDVPVAVFAGAVAADRLAAQVQDAVWIVDALLGTGARGEPRPPVDRVIEVLNRADARKLAVDLPSGLDCDTGRQARHTFRAHHTCTFVTAKPGFFAPGALTVIGTLHVLDIGAPRQLVTQLLRES